MVEQNEGSPPKDQDNDLDISQLTEELVDEMKKFEGGSKTPKDTFGLIRAVADKLVGIYNKAKETPTMEDDLEVEILFDSIRNALSFVFGNLPDQQVAPKLEQIFSGFLSINVSVYHTKLVELSFKSLEQNINDLMAIDQDWQESAEEILKTTKDKITKLQANGGKFEHVSAEKNVAAMAATLKRDLFDHDPSGEPVLELFDLIQKAAATVTKEPTKFKDEAELDEITFDELQKKMRFMDEAAKSFTDESQKRELKKAHHIMERILHENRTISQDRDRGKRDLLRPSTKNISADVYGEVQMFVGEYLNEIDEAERIAHRINLAGNADTITAKEKESLIKIREKILLGLKRYTDMHTFGGQVLGQDEENYLVSLHQEIKKYDDWLGELITLTGAGEVADGGGAGDVETTDSPEIEGGPDQYLEAYLDFYSMATSRLAPKIKTNPPYGEWAPDLQALYDKYKEIEKNADGEETEWSEAKELVSNLGSSWEYQFNTMQSSKGLVHDISTIEIYVNPERWRHIFDKYELSRKLDKENENGRKVEGPFWEMWDIAIQVAVNHEKNTEDEKYKYGDELMNNIDEFYNYVIEKFLMTPSGKKFWTQFQQKHPGDPDNNVQWKLVKEQIMGMFNIGGLIDEIYATKSITGSSIAHTFTSINVNGKDKPLWSIIYPIHYAGYLSNNTVDPKTHQAMNIAMCSEEVLKDLYVRAGKKGEIPIGAEEMIEATELYIDCSLDAHHLLGVYEKPFGFPNFARSVFEFGLSAPKRFFDVELQGWDFLWTNIFRPLGELDEHKAFSELSDWPKQGLGRAKLIKDAITIEDFTNLTEVFFARVFNAFKGNKILAWGRKKLLANAKLVSNVTRETQGLRKRAVEGLLKATTVSYLAENEPIGTERMKRSLLQILGADFETGEADFQQRLEEMKRATAGDSMDDKRTKFKPLGIDAIKLRGGVIKSKAPENITPDFKRKAVGKYVKYMWEHHAYRDLPQALYESWERFKGAFKEAGLAEFVQPPYLLLDEHSEDKK